METPHHIVLRRRAMANVVDFAFSTLAHTSGRLPAANPARYGVERLRDISYGPLGADHTVDVYRPIERSGPLPVVVYFHGGAFRSLSKDTHWLMGIAFARRGYIVVSANYRLAPRHPFPAAAHDACDAWRWATEHVGEYGGDPSRMAVAGESAGANLASVIAVASAWRQTEPRARMIYEETPQPVVALPACGILQVSEPERYRRPGTRLAYEIIANLEHGYLPRDRSNLDVSLADPLCVVERSAPDRAPPPFFLPVGTRDALVPDSERMAVALQGHRARADLRLYDGEIHAFHAFIWRKNARLCWKEMLAFLDEHARPSAGARAAG